MGSNTIRFSGMASGLDTESMVKAMVARYQTKVDDKKKEQTLLEWKKDAYKSMNSKFYGFYTGTASSSRLQSTFLQKQLVSSEPTKVSVKSSGSAPEGTHTINQVSQLATSATIETHSIGKVLTDKISSDNTVAGDTKLSDIGLEDNITIKLSDGLGNAELEINKDWTLEDLSEAINITANQNGLNIRTSFSEKNQKFDVRSTTGNSQNISISAVDSDDDEALKKVGLKTSNITSSTKLSDLGITSEYSLGITVAGKETEVIIKGTMTVGEFEAEVRQAAPNASVSFDASAGAFFISSKKTGSSQEIGLKVKNGDSEMNSVLSKLGIGNKSNTVTINNTTGGEITETTTLGTLGVVDGTVLELNDGLRTFQITVKSTSTINDITEVINSQIPNVEASWDAVRGRFNFTNTNMAVDEPISMSLKNNVNEEIFSTGAAQVSASIAAKGTNSHYKYNGIDMQSESNTATVNGMEITFNGTTSEAVTISSTMNTEGALKFIQDFVSAYNTLIADANEQRNADSAGTLKPLTSEEKEAMSDSDIATWEKKIKDSLLRRDSTLTDTLYDMRAALSSVVEGGTFKSLSSIGITTSSILKEYGKLTIDEDKLKAALSEDPEGIATLFAGGRSAQAAYLQANSDKTATDYDALTKDEKAVWEEKVKGLGERLYEALGKRYTGINDVKSATVMFNDLLIDEEIKTAKSDYEILVDRLNDKEDYYYKRMAAMETMMNKLNSQSNYLAQLGGTNS